jgi:sulfite dehydrogenase (cytochrome) subunit B
MNHRNMGLSCPAKAGPPVTGLTVDWHGCAPRRLAWLPGRPPSRAMTRNVKRFPDLSQGCAVIRSIARMACFAAFAIALGGAAMADEMPVTLKAGAGLDKVEGNCGACHSLDYIRMNSPFLDASGWDAEVTKMIKSYGAPISAADAKIIGDYLKAHYGQ